MHLIKWMVLNIMVFKTQGVLLVVLCSSVFGSVAVLARAPALALH